MDIRTKTILTESRKDTNLGGENHHCDTEWVRIFLKAVIWKDLKIIGDI